MHDPAIQNALTDKITVQITSHLNVTGITNQAAAVLASKGLPRVGTLLKTFAPSIASAVTGFVHSTVQKIVTSPQFANVWIQVNTVAHQQVVKVLSGQGGGAISTSNGQVVLDLGPFISIVKQDPVKRGFTLVNNLPPIHPSFVLFQSKDLVKAQTGYRLINDLKIVLPLLTLLLLGLGVYVARRHRRALIGAGLGLAASMLVLGAGLLIFRGIYLNHVPESTLPSDATAAMFDTFVRFIKAGLRTILVLEVVVAACVFLTGPSVTAVRTRAAIGSGRRGSARRRARRGIHRAGLQMDLCAPARAAHLGRGAHRPAVRVLGPAHGRRRHRARRPAAGHPRADRAGRPPARDAGDGRPAVTSAAPRRPTSALRPASR